MDTQRNDSDKQRLFFTCPIRQEQSGLQIPILSDGKGLTGYQAEKNAIIMKKKKRRAENIA